MHARTKQARCAAEQTGLQYVSDSAPGIRRVSRGRSFSYVGPDGKTDPRPEDTFPHPGARDPAGLEGRLDLLQSERPSASDRPRRSRSKAVSLSPAVARGPRRKQVREADQFAQTLPRIRRRVASDLRRRGLPREKVLAAVVKLLETTLVRVGNDEYAKSNNSFGLTTMRDRHAEVNGSKVRMKFKGKSGVNHEIDIRDPRIAKIVAQCQDLPGQELFQYVDDQGAVRDIGSADVNEYLREISGQDFTAKDFRTWAGTALAAQALQEFEDFDSQGRRQAKHHAERSNAWRSDWEIPRRSAASATSIRRSSTPTWIVRWSQP